MERLKRHKAGAAEKLANALEGWQASTFAALSRADAEVHVG
jgi:hypothetical protein